MDQQQQTATLLVCTDIFGVTAALHHWLAALPVEVQLLSPYSQMQQFEHAQAAYQFFTEQGGLPAYQQKLTQWLASQTKAVDALGFSAGAAVLWSAIAAQPKSPVKRCWLFYGGQIRQQPELQPNCPTQLIWAEETHFDVVALHQQLAAKPLVQSELTPYPHGFINPASSGYRSAAAASYQQWLATALQDEGLSDVAATQAAALLQAACANKG